MSWTINPEWEKLGPEHDVKFVFHREAYRFGNGPPPTERLELNPDWTASEQKGIYINLLTGETHEL